MEKIKQTLLANWDFMRWLRLGLGIFAAVQSFLIHDAFLGFLGVFFLVQALTNTGCGGNSCAIPPEKNSSRD